MVTRPAGHFGDHPNKACRGKVEAIDEGVDEADGVLGANVFVQRFREQQGLGPVVTGDVRYIPDSNASQTEPKSVRGRP